MDKSIYTESAWCRGWRDTKAAWTSWQFLIFDSLGGGVVALLSHIFAQQWFWGAVVAVAGFLVVWFGIIIRTPVKQRNEARDRVKELEKPDKTLEIREALMDLWREAHDIQFECITKLNVPVPKKRSDDWQIRAGKYIGKNLGRDYIATFLTLNNSVSTDYSNYSGDRKIVLELLTHRMSRIEQFMTELRAKKSH